MKALRLLVVRAQAAINPQDPASADLARDLLGPIETWEHTTAKPANDAAPTPEPPALTPAPATADHAVGAGGTVAGGTKSAG